MKRKGFFFFKLIAASVAVCLSAFFFLLSCLRFCGEEEEGGIGSHSIDIKGQLCLMFRMLDSK